MPDFDSTLWIAGWVAGGAVVVVVAVLAITLITLAGNIRRQTGALHEALARARDATVPLWSLERGIIALGGAVEAARRARSTDEEG